MKEYIFSVLAISAIGSIILLLSPNGEGDGIRKHVSLVVSLAVILVVISPLLGVLEGFFNLEFDIIEQNADNDEEYESIFHKSLDKIEINNLKAGIKSALYEKYGIDESECSVEVTVNGRELTRVLVRLYGSAVWCDSNAIEEYLYGLLGCEIVTAIN